MCDKDVDASVCRSHVRETRPQHIALYAPCGGTVAAQAEREATTSNSIDLIGKAPLIA